MPTNKTRRRFLQIIGTTSLFSPSLLKQSFAQDSLQKTTFHRWQGIALGGHAEILLPNEKRSEILAWKIRQEIKRLENIFSLYIPNSEINRLNTEGKILNPSPELYHVISIANEVSKLTKGAFDITVQPLWLLHSEMPNLTDYKRQRMEQAVTELVDYRNINFSAKRISFRKPGMAITLNGIAQGFITDRIYHILKSQGLTNSLVNIGEIKALGTHPSGREWIIEIDNEGQQLRGNSVNLQAGKAIATSTPTGTVLCDGHSHLLSVHNLNSQSHNKSQPLYQSMSVIADSTIKADALSTGLSFIQVKELQNIISMENSVQIIAKTNAGETIRI
ncbi:FAD:protein FMN transferase [Kiloniella sp. EL199]|uniref:FAD:protein FMN transferase n=1 Tax=Kiloniella sp. EL199 TaxID=2107581 RepID=UPI000EA13A25|nr:FAD:protein FMN transferase [Kiloniella sp. EL199]